MNFKIEKPNHSLFYSRQDPRDPRLGEIILESTLDDIAGADAVILGVPEDRGIVANKGLAGAAQGPDGIRRRLYRLTPGFNMDITKLKICDIGNLSVKDLSLEQVHAAMQELVKTVVESGAVPIVLGSGHDLTYPGLAGFAEGLKMEEGDLGLINVDCHLDVRDDKQGINSGTPFYRAPTQMPRRALHGDSFVEFGIQEPYNSP